MKAPVKSVFVLVLLVLAGSMSLSAQHRGGDRLPRILDPLGILPTPRQVIRSLDHVARVLPPVVIESRADDGYGYEDGCDPGRRGVVLPAPRHRYIQVIPRERFERRGWNHGRPHHGGWR